MAKTDYMTDATLEAIVADAKRANDLLVKPFAAMEGLARAAERHEGRDAKYQADVVNGLVRDMVEASACLERVLRRCEGGQP